MIKMTKFQKTIYKKLDNNILFTEEEIRDLIGGTLQFKNRMSQKKLGCSSFEIIVISKVGKRYVKNMYIESFDIEKGVFRLYNQPVEVSEEEYKEMN